MAEPTLIQVFGADAAVANDIFTADITQFAVPLAGVPSSEAITVAAMLSLSSVQDTDPNAEVVISAPAVSQQTRNNVNETRFRYTVDVYRPVEALDPSDL
ncbi:MAG: hypothetical protein HC924_15950 [Synechococcaceae cyanobacterium SM2_3_2]|nr:hypothetical protein [Synechococcaceae cyanobacterium SM2_3_2]